VQHEPLISVITPVYDTAPDVLAECIASVRRQSYGKWQLCLVDDASPSPHVWPQLEAAVLSDRRIFAHRREANGGIVAASNDAIAMSTGDVVVLLDHDDLLHPEALRQVATQFNQVEDLDYLYSDEDLVDVHGNRVNPFLKPDWSPERFRTQMYTCHLSAIRREVGDAVGWFREGFDGAQDWDLVLRVTERAREIRHIPKVLYHWRVVPASVLSGDDVKPYAYESARKAIAEHCERVGIRGEVVEFDRRGHFRVVREVWGTPLVSIVIPTRGSAGVAWGLDRTMVVEAVRSIVNRSTWTNYEIVLVADDVTPPDVLAELEVLAGHRLRVVPYDRPFNFSEKCNLGAAWASGELLLFLNDDVEVITPEWMEVLIGFAQEPDVGAAGCRLLFEDGTIQHVGHVMVGGNPAHLMLGRSPESVANRMAVWLDREVAGVTAAALMCRAEVFDQVGGFSPELPGNYNDVDFCMKVRSQGYRVVVSPHASLYHFESATRDPTVVTGELERIRARWWEWVFRDPYYNPNHHPGLDGYPDPVAYP
jgi:glycosyltransferase involved in cell wall biosynthesis